jgi:ribose/xylose/arabinose/galactoside ABC-type transport system permease subunit
VGLANGLAIGCLRVNPIIWTLATGAGVGGFIRWAYSGTQVYPDASQAAGRAFLHLYGARVLGVVPMSVTVLLAMAAGSALLMTRTLFGFDARLTGSSYEAARLSGVRTSSVTAWAFVLSGAASAVGGMMLTSLNKVGAPYIGKGYDFLAVTAIVLGRMTLAGGRGSVLGVLAGVLIIGLLRNVMNLLGWGTFQQDIAQGVVFIAVVGYAAMLSRRRGQDDA